jgi:RHS repeat-associated protein
MQYPSGELITTTYNAAGQPVSLTNKWVYSPNPDPLVTAASYNVLGQPTQINFGNGLRTRYMYWGVDYLASGLLNYGRLRRICLLGQSNNTDCEADPQNTSLLFNMGYNYNLAGGVSVVRDETKGQRETALYDSLYRLTAVVSNSLGIPVQIDYYNEHYAYDGVGNLLSRSSQLGSGAITTNTLGYAGAQPHAVTTLNGVQRYWYDANGNMTQRVELSGTQWVTYTQGWDIDNRLIAVTNTVSGQVSRFYYDADGQRVKRVDPSGTTAYIGQHFEVQASAGISTSYYYFGSQRVAMRIRPSGSYSGTLYWIQGDQLGSASLTTNITGTIVSEQRYYPFGETRWVSSTMPTDRLFTGQRSELYAQGFSPIYDFGGRFFSPLLGRFLSADSIIPRPGDPQSYNRYSYASNSPLTRIDPSGHADTCDTALYNCGPVYTPPVPLMRDPFAPRPILGPPSLVVHPQPVPRTLASYPYQPDHAMPFQVGWEWLTGTGPRQHNFVGGDPFTELLKQHDHIEQVRATVSTQLSAGDYTSPGHADYNLSGLQGVPKYVKDYSTLATGGTTGNLAVTYLGSYQLDYNIVRVDPVNGIAEVSIHVHNDSTIASATHPPVLGYTPWWDQNIGQPLDAAFSQGPMSPTSQDFWWSELVAFGGQR